ncbi:tetratricopeptide repeat protein [Rhizobium lusitanum]|jgi:tetratricopeptide (TPR) repeat protein|uniref:Tetratricopeptide repeat-containing protein n=1 Tax=Rhizobium lusitanum TaxID=293958 RepID=A0A1C3X1Y8_9HYPH|nr:tetratricopeptide repeat protein [Rhizobium lusitanum]SCB46251.1 Tetratricopeptide repeat-containing protein [Rhizobium lusitanum]
MGFKVAKKSSAMMALTAGFLLTASLHAFAAGTENDETAPPPKSKTTTECTDGKVWDKDKKECVKPKESGFNDDQLFQAAREFAYAGQYDNAITVLKLAKNQDDPRILNYLGYSNRKAGRMELGMSYYRKALQRDENYILARSYMGQALLAQGDVQGARVQLVEIRDRGGENTWAYRSLLQSLKGQVTY